jgi:toxin YhaV
MNISWQIYFFKIFETQLTQLKNEVKDLSIKDPDNYKNHKKTKLLAKIYTVIFKDIQTNPLDAQFNLGNTLGKKHRSWKRAKNRLPARYRMFFKCNSGESKVIIAWMNNEFTLRKRGSRTDAYSVFLSMIGKGDIPSDWKQLSSMATASKK